MTDITYRTLDGSRASIQGDRIIDLGRQLHGTVLTAADADYDSARAVWNAMVDHRPAVIVRCQDVDDIRRAVDFAHENRMLVAIRGGGHNIAGKASCDSGLVIDLSGMKTVQVEPEQRTARVAPGATLADFDREAQAHGLATPLGINSTTGVAGLTLGGGFGWLSRRYGLTVDNLISAEVVTADGNLRVASDTENPDLFWALQGGGGNFGVVSSFEFRLHPVGPDVYSGLVVYSLDDAPEVLRQWRDFAATAPDDLTVWAILRKAPPLPFLPEAVHGTNVVAFPVLYSGSPEEGERLADPVRHFGKPLGEHLGAQPYAAFQSAFDPLLTPGARNYWKSHDLEALPDEAIDKAVALARELPSDSCEVFMAQLGGAVSRVPETATAYAGRGAAFIVNVHGRWDTPEEDNACVAWSRHVFAELAPFATGNAYVNFLTEDESARVPAAYGPNYARLLEVKRRYDPENLFRVNQNIDPAQTIAVA
jgi:FAD/FMN-containing dehydrogenase